MKVILLRDVKDLGRTHEIVTAADGHALNFLIPKRLAVAATPGALLEAELRRKQTEEKRKVEHALLAGNLSALAEARIVIRVKANEQGHLYDGVGEREIRDAVKEQAHALLPEGVIRLPRPIKEIGTHEVPVALGENFGKFSVIVESE